MQFMTYETFPVKTSHGLGLKKKFWRNTNVKKINLEASELKPSIRAALVIVEMALIQKSYIFCICPHFFVITAAASVSMRGGVVSGGDPANILRKIDKCCQLFKILRKWVKMCKNTNYQEKFKIKWRTKTVQSFREYIYWKMLCHSAKI
jgi:hypothetical protein